MKIGDLIWLGQRLADAGRSEVQEHAPDVPTAELVLMGDLLNNPPSTITSIAERTGYAQSRVSTAVAGLVERGWAETRSDPADGRRTLVLVRDDMRHAAQGYKALSEARTMDRLLAGVPPRRQEMILEVLEELLEVLRQQAAEDRPGPSGALHRGLTSSPEPTTSPKSSAKRTRGRR